MTEFTVQPWTLEAMAGRADRVSGECGLAAGAAADVQLPPRAFGGVSHSTRLYARCTSFRDAIGDAGADIAMDASDQAESLTAAAGAYRNGDEGAAAAYLRLKGWF